MLCETPIRLIGLRTNADLNGQEGVISGIWDGERYPVTLKRGLSIRVKAHNLLPSAVDEFVAFQQHLFNEICVFARYFQDKPNDLPIHMARRDVSGFNAALSTRLVRARLSGSSGLLQLYEVDQKSPCLQLMPCLCEFDATDTTVAYTVSAEDTFTAFSIASGDEETPFFEVRCSGRTRRYENSIPRFHLSIETMRELTSSALLPHVLENQRDISRFVQGTKVKTCCYRRDEQMLFFCDDEETTCKVISFQWSACAFKVARRSPATTYKLRVIYFIETDTTPTFDADRVLPLGAAVIVRDQRSKGIVESKESGRYRLSSGLLVRATEVSMEPMSFLCAQVVFAAHFLEFLDQKQLEFDDGTHEILAVSVLRQRIATLMVTASLIGEEIIEMMKRNQMTRADEFLLSTAFFMRLMDNPKRLIAFFSNLEAVSGAFDALSRSERILRFDFEEDILVLKTDRWTIRVAASDMDPIQGQRSIFKLDCTDKDGEWDVGDHDASKSHVFSTSKGPKVLSPSQPKHKNCTIGAGLNAGDTGLYRTSESTMKKTCTVDAAMTDLDTASTIESDSQTKDLASSAEATKTETEIAKKVASDATMETAVARSCRLQQELIEEEEGRATTDCKDTDSKLIHKNKRRKKKKKKPKKASTHIEEMLNTSSSSDDDDDNEKSVVIDRATTPTLKTTPLVQTSGDGGVDDDDDGFTIVSSSRIRRGVTSKSLLPSNVEPIGQDRAGFAVETQKKLKAAEADIALLKKKEALASSRLDDLRKRLAIQEIENQAKLFTKRAEIDALTTRVSDLEVELADARIRLCDEDEIKKGVMQKMVTLQEQLDEAQRLKDQADTRVLEANRYLTDATASYEARDEYILLSVLQKLLAQLQFYQTQPYFKVSDEFLSIPLMMANGFAAKNQVDFYRMHANVSDINVFECLAVKYPDKVTLHTDNGVVYGVHVRQ